MDKKVLFRIVLSIVVAIALGAGFFFVLDRLNPKTKPTAPEISTQISPTPQPLLTWKDQAGFTFQYPEGLTIDKHEEDKENYAHIEFNLPGSPGSLIVWAKDTRAKDAAAWVKSEKTFISAQVVDTTFAGQEGKKVLVATPEKKVFVGTVSDKIVFYIEATLADEEYWSKTLETISESFVFIPQEVAEQGGGSSQAAGGEVYSEEEPVDEEEIVQ